MTAFAAAQSRARSAAGSGSTTIVARTASPRYSPGTSVGAMRTSERRRSTVMYSTCERSSVPLGLSQAASAASMPAATARPGCTIRCMSLEPRHDFLAEQPQRLQQLRMGDQAAGIELGQDAVETDHRAQLVQPVDHALRGADDHPFAQHLFVVDGLHLLAALRPVLDGPRARYVCRSSQAIAEGA